MYALYFKECTILHHMEILYCIKILILYTLCNNIPLLPIMSYKNVGFDINNLTKNVLLPGPILTITKLLIPTLKDFTTIKLYVLLQLFLM